MGSPLCVAFFAPLSVDMDRKWNKKLIGCYVTFSRFDINSATEKLIELLTGLMLLIGCSITFLIKPSAIPLDNLY